MLSARSMSLVSIVISLFLPAEHVFSQLVSTGQTVAVHDIQYYVPATPFVTVSLRTFPKFQACGDLTPVTVVQSLVDIQLTVKGYAEADDVWSTGFLKGKRLTVQSCMS